MTEFQLKLILNDLNTICQLNNKTLEDLTDVQQMLYDISLDVNNEMRTIMPDLDAVLTLLQMTKQYLLFVNSHFAKSFPAIKVHND